MMTASSQWISSREVRGADNLIPQRKNSIDYLLKNTESLWTETPMEYHDSGKIGYLMPFQVIKITGFIQYLCVKLNLYIQSHKRAYLIPSVVQRYIQSIVSIRPYRKKLSYMHLLNCGVLRDMYWSTVIYFKYKVSLQ